MSSSRSSSPPPEGVIEIVKMPPKNQARRMIRRGNFTMKRLNAIHEKTMASSKSSGENKQARSSKQTKENRSNNMKRENISNITYTTSVS